jgi:hypothetical protein
MTNRKRRLWMAGIAAGCTGAALTAVLLIGSPQDSDDDRQSTVAERGQSVMPFDLEQTTHRFTPTKTGGVQDVIADQPDDAKQIGLIRTHLQKEATAFSHGDFRDPAQIHGDSMPGLTGLQEDYERIEVRYQERPEGATLTYTTDEPALVNALHDWFKAQLSDHGDHAESGH